MRLSLVIPVFDEETTIRSCLEHVVAQTRPVDECIVVDNNSTDATLAIVAEFADLLPLRVLHEPQQGVAFARQTGFDAATGDVIGRIDSDTRLEPGWAAAVETFLDAHPEVGAVGGSAYLYDAPGEARARGKIARGEFGASEPRPMRGIEGNNSAIRADAWRLARPNVLNLPGTHEDVDLSYALREAGVELALAPGMIVGLSPRRYNAPASATWRYMMAMRHTQRVHGNRRALVIQTAVLPLNLGIFLIGGAVVKAYDPETGKWRPFRTNRPEARRSPIT